MYIDKEYLILEDKDLKKHKKITGHAFVQLCGKDKFNKRGDCVLDRLGLLPKVEIDPFYTNRGKLAEVLVKKSYEKNGHYCITSDPKEINYDNFPNLEIFGGMYDIIVDTEIVSEVKSKSLANKENIINFGNETEELQGEFYAVLLDIEQCNLDWVFFPKDIEDKIKANEKITSFAGIEKYTKSIKVVGEEKARVIALMQEAITYYDTCYYEKRISMYDISGNVIQELRKAGRLE